VKWGYVYGSLEITLGFKSPLTHARQGIAGYPLFPGENEVEQLACMMEVLGVPPNAVLENATRKKMFFGKHICFLQQVLNFFLQ
jgi:hypothetical protein